MMAEYIAIGLGTDTVAIKLSDDGRGIPTVQVAACAPFADLPLASAAELGRTLMEFSGYEVSIEDDDGTLSLAQVVALAAVDQNAQFEPVDWGYDVTPPEFFRASGSPLRWATGAAISLTTDIVNARWREVVK